MFLGVGRVGRFGKGFWRKGFIGVEGNSFGGFFFLKVEVVIS